MPNKHSQFWYWDSSVFMSYINAIPERVDVIQAWWDYVISDKDRFILTSSLAIAEVAYATREQMRQVLDPAVERKLEAFWGHPSVIVVEADPTIMRDARALMREVIALGEEMVLRPLDAIHLATAKRVNANGYPIIEVYTYDKKWRNPHYARLTNVSIVYNPSLPPPPSEQTTMIDDGMDFGRFTKLEFPKSGES